MAKQCCHHKEERRQVIRPILAGVVGFITLILIIIFLVWIILRPTKPRFILQDATVFAFNLSSKTTEPSACAAPAPFANTLTTTLQLTLSALNPNDRIGIYYQKLDVYVSYRGQQISLATALPPSYQGHRDVTVWSPFLYGTSVPVPPYLLNCLQQDQLAGGALLNLKVNGRVKWKVGTWVSGRYHLDVNCPAYIRLAAAAAAAADDDNCNANAIRVATPAVKFQLFRSCNVDVSKV